MKHTYACGDALITDLVGRSSRDCIILKATKSGERKRRIEVGRSRLCRILRNYTKEIRLAMRAAPRYRGSDRAKVSLITTVCALTKARQ